MLEAAVLGRILMVRCAGQPGIGKPGETAPIVAARRWGVGITPGAKRRRRQDPGRESGILIIAQLRRGDRSETGDTHQHVRWRKQAGRAQGRDRGCMYGYIWGVDGSLKKKYRYD